MKEAIGVTHISYSVKCPHCGETTYSRIHYDLWESSLEYGDGKPHGIIICPDCNRKFQMEIGDEIL